MSPDQRINDLYDGTKDALFQMERYGGRVFDEKVLAALWALTSVNDDLWHGRDGQCVRESVAGVQAALERIVAPAPAPQWRPIETAPKDATRVLICKATDADGKPIDSEAFGLFVQRAAWWEGDNAWIVYNGAVREEPAFFEPTHWMPLPAAPEAGQGKDAPPSAPRPDTPALAPLTAERDALRRIVNWADTAGLALTEDLVNQARAALVATPAPELLTDEQILRCFHEAVPDYVDVSDAEVLAFGRAVMSAMLDLATPAPCAECPEGQAVAQGDTP